MSKIAGKIFDKATGQPIAARVQVLNVEGRFVHPRNSLLKVGPGEAFFYSDGGFEVETDNGYNSLLVERGSEYVPARLGVNVPSKGTVTVEIALERWNDLQSRCWYPGNTHIHYDQFEQQPDARLRLDPRVEDLRVTCLSIIKRWDRPYAVNQYSPGVLTDFCTAHHHVECGEESRHNDRNDDSEGGYGHIMLLRIKEAIEPISRGFLLEETDPDYPPLCYACDDAHRQGGIVIWCHNGRGMEAPVAAALGKLDAFNLFDPFWMDPEYRLWYAMLNCGFQLPASTGSDWFICSANRVYVYTGKAFGYDDWVQGLQQGRTFITNGPALFLTVNDHTPGDLLRTMPGKDLEVTVSWKSHFAIEQVELIQNGKVVGEQQFLKGSNDGQLRVGLKAESDGWISARLGSRARDSYNQALYAHTSPVYVETGVRSEERGQAAALFDRALDQAMEKVNAVMRFRTDQQRREVLDLFKQGQDVYRSLLSS